MGPEFRGAAIEARKGAALHYCGHGGDSGDGPGRRRRGDDGEGGPANDSSNLSSSSKPSEPCLPAAACLATCVGPASNAEHFIVATQDRSLRAALGQAPAGAAIFLTASGLQFEPPTEAQRRHVAAVGAADRGVLPGERAFPASKKSSPSSLSAAGGGGGDGNGGDSDGGERGGGRLWGAEALEEVARAARRAWARDTSVSFRRNKAKGPNPLSVKKKKTKANMEAPKVEKEKKETTPTAPTTPAKDKATKEKKRKADVSSSPKERQKGNDEDGPNSSLEKKVRMRPRRKKRPATEGGGRE